MGGDESKEAPPQDTNSNTTVNGSSNGTAAKPTPRQKGTEVFLNVYKLTDSDFMGMIGLGLFHTGLQVYGREYAYGQTDEDCSGIFWLVPRSAHMPFKEAVSLGRTLHTPGQVLAILEKITPMWNGRDYEILTKNCNHFTEAFATELGLTEFPSWVNRAARFGDTFVPNSVIDFVISRLAEQPPTADEEGTEHVGGDTPTQGSPSNKATSTGGKEQKKQPRVITEGAQVLQAGVLPNNLERLSVRELRRLLYVNGLDWDDCVERDDMVAKLRQNVLLKSNPQSPTSP
eukprot:TRINITY_DN15748_c0_g1_i1.p1 TRINITY_DN15748_c0_g1~~TRINITY_DN15748_c0_g1_i1.p1  ORF type:complete len:287 (+),score=67.82 TRINITY_DN15748_c0_g1_i1:242-1102(+)